MQGLRQNRDKNYLYNLNVKCVLLILFNFKGINVFMLINIGKLHIYDKDDIIEIASFN